jgi:hypothetical protein
MPKKTEPKTTQCNLMSSQPSDSRTSENYRRALVADFPNQKIQNGSKLSIASACFNHKTYDHDHKSHHAVFQAV